MKDMEPNRDKKLDDLLRASLTRQTSAATGPQCLDAETAAAWADDALNTDERARAEKHVAGCARCQALVAALVTTAPPAPARASWFRFSRAAWLAPLTAAAAAVIVWAVMPASKSTSQSGGGVSRELTLADSRDAARGGTVAPQSAQSAVVPAAPPAEAAAIDKDQEGTRARAQVTTPTKGLKEQELKKEQRIDEAPEKLKAAPAASNELQARDQAKRDANTREVVGGIAAAASPAPSPPPQTQQQQLSPSQQQSLAESARLRQSAAVDALAAKSVPLRREPLIATVIAASNSLVRWRLANEPQLRATSIERSVDGGSSWTSQAFVDLTRVTTGASPSPLVCWLVGEQGAVALTTNGRTWERLTFPEAIDLVGVRAIDENQATVTAADGRTFSTADRGLTWTAVPRD
jgi:hypothetical protein